MQHQHRDRAPPGSDEAGRDSHRAGPKINTQQHHSGGAVAAAQERDKAFATLRAQLAQRGFTLARTDSRDGDIEFVVGFRGIHKVLRTIGAVEAFCRTVGAMR